MNVVFVSDDSSSVKLLKSELNKHIRASQDKLSPDEKNSPADLGQVIVEQVGVTPDGLLQLPDAESFQGDVVVLDCAVTGKRTEQVISDTTHRAPGVPVILLTDPADETVEVDAINAGATDCIAKTDKYLNRLLPIIERELQRRKRTHEKSDSSSREDRLRQVVEKLPVGVAVIAPEGTFLAINQAGLKNLGAAKLDQIVGKKIQHLVEKKDHYRSLAFLTTVSGGKDDSLYLRWKGLNGKETGIQLHATPMRRQGIKGAAVLAAIYTPGEPDETQNSKKEAKEGTDLKKALQELKGQFQGLQKNHSLQKSKWEAAMQQLENKSLEWEQKARETEKQQAELKTALDESEKNRKQQAEEYEAERARWEEIRREWEQNNSETQEQQTGMQSTLREAGEQLSAIEAALQEKEELRAAMETALQEAAEKSTALEAALQEEKEQRAAMETSLKEAEERRRQQNEILDTERAGWEQSRQELEQRVREVEAQRAAVQAILRETEEKQAALETLLQEAEESRKQQAEVFDAERSRWEQSRQEWDEKLREAGEQHAANLQSTVRDMEDRYNRICEENQAKESQLEEIGRELQQLKEDIENLQSALSEEKLRYQKVSQISSVGVVITTLEGRVLECNDSAARLFGYAGAEDALSQADDESNFRIFTYQGTLGERLRREGRLENIEWSSLSLDGRLIRLREDALLLEDSEGDNPRIERVLTDITQVYRLSEEIRRIRKVESTGDLLAAAVKNLKNICESLADSSKLLKENPDDGNTIQQVAEKLLKDADRGAKNVRQFLSVSAKTDRVPAVVNMNEILADNDPVLRSLVGENIDLQIHSLSDRSLITADRQETVQLISNLVLSSMKTLPLGGTVSIETENIEVDASTSEHPDNLPSGTFVLVTISADGCDVLPERRMSYNKSIMDRIGGWISTTNDPQTGNVHRLYFPRVESFAGRTTLASDGTGTESSE